MEAFGHDGMRDHARWIDYMRSDQYAFQSYFKFSFVRSPLTRLHSAYQYLKRGGNGSKRDSQLASFLRVNNINFSEFVIDSITPRIIREELLFWEQSKFIFDDTDRLMVDYLGKVESIEHDMKFIVNQLSIPPVKTLPTTNSSQPLLENVESKVIDRVCHLYSRDIKLLGYKF